MKDCDSGGRGAGDLPRARAVFVLPEKLASSLQALSGAAALSSQQGGCSVCDQRVPPPPTHVMPAKAGGPPQALRGSWAQKDVGGMVLWSHSPYSLAPAASLTHLG